MNEDEMKPMPDDLNQALRDELFKGATNPERDRADRLASALREVDTTLAESGYDPKGSMRSTIAKALGGGGAGEAP